MGSAVSSQESNSKKPVFRPKTPINILKSRALIVDEAQSVPTISAAPPVPDRPPSAVSNQVVQSSIKTINVTVNNNQQNKARVAIYSHSRDSVIAKQIQEQLQQKSFVESAIIIYEGGRLEYREVSVRWADGVVLVASAAFQQNIDCLEITNYAKDKGKKVVVVVVQPSYNPTGVVGAVGKAYGEIVWMNMNAPMSEVVDKVGKFEPLDESRKIVEIPKDDQSSIAPSSKVVGEADTVYISFTEGTSAKVSEIIHNGTGISNYGARPVSMMDYKVVMGSPNEVDEERIKQCRVFIPILSNAYQTSPVMKQQYEMARRFQKNIVAVKAEKFTFVGWMALGMGGKLFFEIKDQNEADAQNPKVPGTNKMTQLIVSVMAGLKSMNDETTREEYMKANLNKQIEEIKPKLSTWPPKNTFENRTTEPFNPCPDKKDLLPANENKVDYSFIRERVTAMTFKPLYDDLGLPLTEAFDCMISYQWGIQDFVEKMCNEMNFRDVKVWMDVYGGMMGNVNDSMARAVEASACIVVCLTNKYQQSVNCMLELKYALALNKPLIIVLAEDNIQPSDIVKPLLDKYLTLTMKSYGDMEVLFMGYPKFVILTDAVRKIAEWKARQLKPLPTDMSEEVYNLEVLLENAKAALAEDTGTSQYLTCTRCNGKFEANNKGGCKMHRTYYMGGTIVAGRWWCCQQSDKNSLGCVPTDHTTATRSFGSIPGYGSCFQWTPP